jgi:acid phosphatase
MKGILLSVLILGACTPAVAVRQTPAPAAPAAPSAQLVLPRETHWFRNSAEYQAIALETYRSAATRIAQLAQNRQPGTWAVILDADETVLDNSEYQRRLAQNGGSYNDSTWNAWVRERAAPAIPGAVEFLASVRRLGGRIAVVTNRDEEVCADTRANLDRLTLTSDAVLCRINRVSDKNPRFEAVARGTAVPGVPAVEILMWVGDNIQDFPRLTQAARTNPEALGPFGDRWFMLPNPMYGSFESNPHR